MSPAKRTAASEARGVVVVRRALLELLPKTGDLSGVGHEYGAQFTLLVGHTPPPLQ